MDTRSIKELVLPAIFAIGFFVLESSAKLGEVWLTGLVTVLIGATFCLAYHKKEWQIFFIGLVLGVFIEIGMRIFGFQQVWNDASLFGVPLWLPLIWGFGFIWITRLGINIRKN